MRNKCSSIVDKNAKCYSFSDENWHSPALPSLNFLTVETDFVEDNFYTDYSVLR